MGIFYKWGALVIVWLLGFSGESQAVEVSEAYFCLTRTARDKCEVPIVGKETVSIARLSLNEEARPTIFFRSLVTGNAQSVYAHVVEREGSCYHGQERKMHRATEIPPSVARTLLDMLDSIEARLGPLSVVTKIGALSNRHSHISERQVFCPGTLRAYVVASDGAIVPGSERIIQLAP